MVARLANDAFTNDGADLACFHCGLAFPLRNVKRVLINGAERDMCCVGCAAVAEAIVASGLGDYYRHRQIRPAAPAEILPDWLKAADNYDLDGVRQEFVQTAGNGLCTVELLLEGINCPACAWLAEQRLQKLPGARKATVNYATQRALISWQDGALKLADILCSLAAVGLRARPFDAAGRIALRRSEKRRRFFELAVAGLGMMQVMMYAVPVYLAGPGDIEPRWLGLMQWASLAMTVPVVLISARSFFAGAWRDLQQRQIGMDVPIALAILVAFMASVGATLVGHGEVYFDSITMFVFLLLGARYLEAQSTARAVDVIERLGNAAPATALRVAGYPQHRECVAVAAALLKPSDVVMVSSGAQVPADGRIVEGEGAISEAVITGESRALAKGAGDKVIGGSLNAGSPLFVEVQHAGADSLLAHITRLAASAMDEKPAAAELANRIAAKFSAIVLVLATLTAIAWWPAGGDAWLRHAIAVLVVTCPCALALATPAALAAATGRLSAIGLLLTRGNAIERLAAISDIIFDKTGTLTRNEMRLVQIHLIAGIDRQRALDLAAALEFGSSHPLADAMRRAAAGTYNSAAAPMNATALSHHAAQGIEGYIDGDLYRIGTADFVSALVGKPLDPEASAQADASRVFLGRGGQWLARFDLQDLLRPAAAEAIAALHRAGLRVHLLSGDMPAVVRQIASELGVDGMHVRARQTPADKLAYLADLQRAGCVVAMVGDGVNDAPVLAQADVSLAMGSGTDLARANADAVLLSGRLESLPEAVHLARATRRTIIQNLAWATAYNLIAVPLAMIGWVSPWQAALGMSASSLLVVANAARLQGRAKPIGTTSSDRG